MEREAKVLELDPRARSTRLDDDDRVQAEQMQVDLIEAMEIAEELRVRFEAARAAAAVKENAAKRFHSALIRRYAFRGDDRVTIGLSDPDSGAITRDPKAKR